MVTKTTTKTPKTGSAKKTAKPPILSGREALEALKGGKKKVAAPATPAKADGGKPETKAAKKDGAKEAGKMSGLDAAAKVLAETGTPMNCKTIVEQMIAKGYWSSGGKTPAATIYSAILREIDNKPGESRFVKTDRGLFALATPKKS